MTSRVYPAGNIIMCNSSMTIKKSVHIELEMTLEIHNLYRVDLFLILCPGFYAQLLIWHS